MSCLEILELNPLLVASFSNIFSLLWVVFHFVYGFLCCAKDFNSHLFTFAFIFINLGEEFWKRLLWFRLKSVLLMFSSRSFIVSGLAFKSLSCLISFLSTLENAQISLLYMQLSSFPSIYYWKECLSPWYRLAFFFLDQLTIGVWTFFFFFFFWAF